MITDPSVTTHSAAGRSSLLGGPGGETRWLRILTVGAYALANLALLILLAPAPNADWATTWWWLETDPWAHFYRYSPAFLPVMHAVVAIGPIGLGILHVVAVGMLWRLGTAIVILFGFSAFVWTDTIAGNLFTFVLVAGAFAASGSRVGKLIFLAFTLVMPRPVQLPLAVWILWRQPETRNPFVAMFVVHALLVLASGDVQVWLATLVGSGSEVSADYSLGPGSLIGPWWLLLGVPLGAWLTWRDQPALAGLAVSPYLLPQYLGTGLLAAGRTRRPLRPGVSPRR
jgi:hypothetical protein